MKDVIVIGAGVCGLGPAWRLAQRGFDVLVLEAETAGFGASTAAAGMLAPTAEVWFEELELLNLGRESLAMWRDFATELHEISGIDVDYRDEGTLVVGLDRDDIEAIDHLHTYHVELGLDVERLDGDAARELEPGLSPTAHGALFIPGDHQVDPPLVIDAMVAALQNAGGELREYTPVAEVLHDGRRVTGVKTAEGTEIPCRHVVVAAGPWARKLGGMGKSAPYIRPVKGQMLSIELGDPPICKHVIRAPDAYLVPKSSGRMVVGATMEEMGWDDRLTAGGVFELLRGAWETLPGVYDLALIDTWVGFRPMTLDNMPMMRRDPTLDGLIFSVGHGRNGILLTPLTAQRVADLV